MRVPLIAVSVLLGIMPVAASSSPSPAPAHDATHPIVMQQAANEVATAHTSAATAANAPAPASSRQAANTSSGGLQREVFGFALASSLSDPTVGYPSWNFSLLSTVAFFGLHINDDGTIASDSGLTVWSSAELTNLLNTAHAGGTKVVLTIIEQDFSSGTPHMCAALTNRATTVAQTVAQVSAKAVDGLNIDFEGLNGTCPNGQSAQSMMTDLARQLRAALPAGSYLSVDTYAGAAADPLGFYDVPGLNAYVDSFFVMAYDLEYSNYLRSPLSCNGFCLGPTAPLAGYYYNDTTTAAQYTAAVPASKVILGVPYYGRKSCVGSVAPNAYASGSVTADTYLDASTESGAPQVLAGSYATHRDGNDPAGKERWDTWFNTTLSCTRELYWDDTAALGLKYDLVNNDGLRGVGIWNLNYGGGAPELWNGLSSHFVGCTKAGLSPNPTSPQPSATQVVFTATSSNCANPFYEFLVLPPGSNVWQVAQPYSSNATFSWDTNGKPVGTYDLSVFARDAASAGTSGSNLGRWDSFANLRYSIVPAPCTAMTATAAPPTGATVGSTVTITGNATGCPNPRYQFWMLGPGGSWTVAQPYSTANTFSWSTAGKHTGSYWISVWVRDASSSGTGGVSPSTYDAYSAFQYSLTSCSGMSTSAAAPTTATVGTTVTITGSATGCPNPRYQFWILVPGGTWTVAQPYSAAGNFTWNTAGRPTGSYWISVWARDAASSGTGGTPPYTYDVYGAFQYQLTVAPPCTSVSASAAPPAGATVGTTVTITGAAGGCPNARYQFWMLAPGGTWTVVQPYSAANSFIWHTGGQPTGSYWISVWARDAGSPGTGGTPPYTYDNYSAVQFSLS